MHDPRAPVDWSDIRSRLSEALAATAQLFSPASARGTHLLEQRARTLSQPATYSHLPDSGRDVLTFTVDQETYAIEAECVLATARPGRLVQVPASPAHFAGLVHWRGHVLAVIDVASLAGAAQPSSADQPMLLILGRQAPAFALLVYPPLEVRHTNPQFVHTAGDAARSPLEQHVRGIDRDQLRWLDGPSLLDDPKFLFG